MRIHVHVTTCTNRPMSTKIMMCTHHFQVEQIIREDYLVEAMEMVEMFCDLLLSRFGMIERMKYFVKLFSTWVFFNQYIQVFILVFALSRFFLVWSPICIFEYITYK